MLAIIAAGMIAGYEGWRHERANRKAAREARRSRLAAISNCHIALTAAAHAARTIEVPVPPPQHIGRAQLPAADMRRMRAARDAVKFYLRQPTEVDAPLLAALTLTRERMSAALAYAAGPVVSIKAANNLMLALNQAAEDIKSIAEEYKLGVL